MRCVVVSCRAVSRRERPRAVRLIEFSGMARPSVPSTCIGLPTRARRQTITLIAKAVGGLVAGFEGVGTVRVENKAAQNGLGHGGGCHNGHDCVLGF